MPRLRRVIALVGSNGRIQARSLSREVAAQTWVDWRENPGRRGSRAQDHALQPHITRNSDARAGEWRKQLPVAIDIAIPVQSAPKTGPAEFTGIEINVGIRTWDNWHPLASDGVAMGSSGTACGFSRGPHQRQARARPLRCPLGRGQCAHLLPRTTRLP
jgi:hypothetical protein